MTGIARPRLPLRLLGAGATLATVLACAPGALNPAAGQLAATTQNWTDQQRVQWYKGSQGSRLIPEAWLMALEAPGSTTLFMDPAHFSQYNYLPASFIPAMAGKERCGDRALPGSNALLPVGFARDCQSDKDLEVTRLRWFKGQSDKENWIGLTCAACHTTTITYNGQTELIDGGPTLADFQGFTDDLTTALAATLADPAKWERFAARIAAGRGARRSIADDGQLRGAVTALLAHQTDLAAYNQTTIRYGHGRLDAVGHILNKVAWLNHDPNPYRGEPNAPVSYPFIWNAGQHDFVQWNGLVPSKNITIGADQLRAGALVRNTSEVIGVFADVTTREKAGLRGYRTSVDVANLMGLEVQLAKLMSPAWPAAFGAPEPAQVERGRLLFESRAFSGRSCRDCHADLKRTDLSTAIVAEMTPIWGPGGLGTDPWMACNAFAYQARGGLAHRNQGGHRRGQSTPGRGTDFDLSQDPGDRHVAAPEGHDHLHHDQGGDRDRTPDRGGHRLARTGRTGYPARPAGEQSGAAAGELPAGRRGCRAPFGCAANAGLQGSSAQRHLGNRALPPQRLGADAARRVAAALAAAHAVLGRQPRIRCRWRRIRRCTQPGRFLVQHHQSRRQRHRRQFQPWPRLWQRAVQRPRSQRAGGLHEVAVA